MARMRPLIHSDKHYVQITRSQTATVSRNNELLIQATEATVANAVDEVVEGATVKAVYIELWILDTSNDGSFVITVSKVPILNTGPTFTNMNSLGTYVNKKNILYTTQGLSPNNGVGNPVPIIRQWIKIPKTKQRFGLGDSLVLTIANNGLNDLEYCGFTTYKELT